jgi:mannose-6-phosphate isomerase
MAIALTQFRGFCGFLPLPTLLLLLTTIPEIRSLIGEGPIEALAQSLDLRAPAADADPAALESLIHLAEAASSKSATSDNGFETTDAQKSALRAIFEVLMTSDDNKVVSTLKGLLKRYNEQGKESCKTRIEADLVDLVTELNEQYPDDVGVLCTFVLNVVELGVGEAVFLRADEPHAYISGGEV